MEFTNQLVAMSTEEQKALFIEKLIYMWRWLFWLSSL